MVRLARSPRVSPSAQSESKAPEAPQEQLSLFAVSGNDETKETVKTEETANIAVMNTELKHKGETKSTGRGTKKEATYSAADIQVLEGIAAIRHRPGMYIGSTSASGLLHLIWE